MTNEMRTNLIKFIRENTLTKTAKTCDKNGTYLKTVTIPMWRSDDCKLIYPEILFSGNEVKSAITIIKDYIKENNLNLKVVVTSNYFIEVANCYGWKVNIVDAK